MNQPPPADAAANSDSFATASGSCCMTGMLFRFAFFAFIVFVGLDGVALVSFDVALVSFDVALDGVVLDGVVLDLSASNAPLTALANVVASFAFGIGVVL
jgi:hypothetical protein